MGLEAKQKRQDINLSDPLSKTPDLWSHKKKTRSNLYLSDKSALLKEGTPETVPDTVYIFHLTATYNQINEAQASRSRDFLLQRNSLKHWLRGAVLIHMYAFSCSMSKFFLHIFTNRR